MSNLASTYRDLGRHEDALAMRERVMEFMRRVLPANHPDIGEGCAGRDALHVLRLIARGSALFERTYSHGREQPCLDEQRLWKGRGRPCDA